MLRTVFIVYLFGLLYFTIFAESLGRTPEGPEGEVRYNLVLFNELRRFWTYREQLGNRAFYLNVVGNVLAFVPCGLLIPLAFPRYDHAAGTVLNGALLSFLIECTQLVFRVGSFDVDDLILNTLGVFVGFLIYLGLNMLSAWRMQQRRITIRELS